LIFLDLERLRNLSRNRGGIQIVVAGKAHPGDESGREIIHAIFEAARTLKPDVRVAFLPNHDMRVARLMTSGADLWLNTPRPPQEASGTSGMKAALNGVPSLSVLDGWWIEGCIEGLTGWAIGEEPIQSLPDEEVDRIHASSLFERLDQTILPMFYQDRRAFTKIMRHAIALNGSFFNTHRMLHEYTVKAYR
ncbi:MAG TPA: alpha-glucan family phosphorylase, partial [Steroidobacteraceae bacterium]